MRQVPLSSERPGAIKATMFSFSVFKSEKIQNLTREGRKKHFRKKTLNLFLKKLMRATK